MKILVVDDDPRLRELVGQTLTRAGFAVVSASNGQQALMHAAREAPDLIVLDIGLPEMDGLEVCRRLRATSAIPILFLTARADEVDRIVGLEMGADDYVTKPFSPRELVARIRAILKRSIPAPVRVLRHGLLTLDPERHHCRAAGAEVHLTAAEMGILAQLMRHPDRVQPRDRLIEAVWGPDHDLSDRTLDSHLRNLRRKLAQAGCPEAVQTLHGIGFRMGSCGG